MRYSRWKGKKTTGTIEAVLSEFQNGRPVIIPTDTVYGLAAPISDLQLLRSIFRIKERPPALTLPVAVGKIDDLDLISRPTEEMKELLIRNLPGPFTFVLPAVEGLPDEVLREGTVALRIPEHPIFSILCERTGPVALTSANIHGRETVYSLKEAEEQLENEGLLMIIDDDGIGGTASEIVDLTNDVPNILRKGKVNIGENMRCHNG